MSHPIDRFQEPREPERDLSDAKAANAEWLEAAAETERQAERQKQHEKWLRILVQDLLEKRDHFRVICARAPAGLLDARVSQEIDYMNALDDVTAAAMAWAGIVGRDGIKPLVWYMLGADGQPVEVSP